MPAPGMRSAEEECRAGGALLNWNLTPAKREDTMIVLGVILLIVGFLTSISILWTIGIVLVVIGLVLWILGAVGHAVGGRKHYY